MVHVHLCYQLHLLRDIRKQIKHVDTRSLDDANVSYVCAE